MKFPSTALVFDLDGTLSDPSTGIFRSFNYALEEHGQPAVAEQLLRGAIGPPLDDTFRELVPGISDAQVLEYVASYRVRYAEIGYTENALYAGIPQALDALRSTGKMLGVCTSKRVDFANMILDMFDLAQYFSFVDGGDVGISKASQLQALQASGVIDSDAIMIGDREVDISAARSNDMRAVGVLWGFGDLAELEGVSPVAIFDHVGQLTELLE